MTSKTATYSPNATRILHADDHVMVRTGMQMMLELKFNITDFHEAASCSGTLSAIRTHKPTHMILDMVLKDGSALEILPNIITLVPELKIMVYSMMPKDVYLPLLNRFGIKHYLNKESNQDVTVEYLKKFLSKEHRPAQMDDHPENLNPFSKLSLREQEVLHYILKGESVQAMSQFLALHKNTICTLRNRLMTKLNARNMVELTKLAAMYKVKY